MCHERRAVHTVIKRQFFLHSLSRNQCNSVRDASTRSTSLQPVTLAWCYHMWLTTIRGKWDWIGHALRKWSNSITKQSLSWTPQGQRDRGRPKNAWKRTLESGDRKVEGDLDRNGEGSRSCGVAGYCRQHVPRRIKGEELEEVRRVHLCAVDHCLDGSLVTDEQADLRGTDATTCVSLEATVNCMASNFPCVEHALVGERVFT